MLTRPIVLVSLLPLALLASVGFEPAKATASGGARATLVLSKSDLDRSKDSAFNVEYLPYVRSFQRKVRSCWKAPETLGKSQVHVSFDTNASGTISNLKVAKSCGDKIIDKQALNARL